MRYICKGVQESSQLQALFLGCNAQSPPQTKDLCSSPLAAQWVSNAVCITRIPQALPNMLLTGLKPFLSPSLPPSKVLPFSSASETEAQSFLFSTFTSSEAKEDFRTMSLEVFLLQHARNICFFALICFEGREASLLSLSFLNLGNAWLQNQNWRLPCLSYIEGVKENTI